MWKRVAIKTCSDDKILHVDFFDAKVMQDMTTFN